MKRIKFSEIVVMPSILVPLFLFTILSSSTSLSLPKPPSPPSSSTSTQKQVQPLKHLTSLNLPSPQLSTTMTLCGALLGPNLDNYHSAFGVLHYANPITLSLPNNPSPILTTAPWVPPLFGLAGLIISTLYYIGDDLSTNVDSTNINTSKLPPTWPLILITISAFTFQYYLSGLMSSVPFSCSSITFVMTATATLGFLLFDRTVTGFVVSAMTAVGGPGIEYFIIKYTQQYEYDDASFLGCFPVWIVPVYFLGGPAVGNLSRGFRFLLEGEGGGRVFKTKDWVCEVCNGSNVVPCGNCDGVGYYSAYGREVKCSSCNGSRRVICRERECFESTGLDPWDIEGIREYMKRKPD